MGKEKMERRKKRNMRKGKKSRLFCMKSLNIRRNDTVLIYNIITAKYQYTIIYQIYAF